MPQHRPGARFFLEVFRGVLAGGLVLRSRLEVGRGGDLEVAERRQRDSFGRSRNYEHTVVFARRLVFREPSAVFDAVSGTTWSRAVCCWQQIKV